MLGLGNFFLRDFILREFLFGEKGILYVAGSQQVEIGICLRDLAVFYHCTALLTNMSDKTGHIFFPK